MQLFGISMRGEREDDNRRRYYSAVHSHLSKAFHADNDPVFKQQQLVANASYNYGTEHNVILTSDNIADEPVNEFRTTTMTTGRTLRSTSDRCVQTLSPFASPTITQSPSKSPSIASHRVAASPSIASHRLAARTPSAHAAHSERATPTPTSGCRAEWPSVGVRSSGRQSARVTFESGNGGLPVAFQTSATGFQTPNANETPVAGQPLPMSLRGALFRSFDKVASQLLLRSSVIEREQLEEAHERQKAAREEAVAVAAQPEDVAVAVAEAAVDETEGIVLNVTHGPTPVIEVTSEAVAAATDDPNASTSDSPPPPPPPESPSPSHESAHSPDADPSALPQNVEKEAVAERRTDELHCTSTHGEQLTERWARSSSDGAQVL